MKKAIIYIHGKGGCAEESKHYETLFPEHKIFGFDYKAQTPWEAQEEFSNYFRLVENEYESVSIIANSIGAFFTLNSLDQEHIEKAYFISPIVDMEKLITDMMQWANVSENELQEKGLIETAFGETLSWVYLSWVRKNPIHWSAPTSILYGTKDNLQSLETISSFAKNIDATLTVMENGEHWFHTDEQMEFLDNWIRG